MSDVYDSWKPLRNFLSKLDVIDSLGVVRAYSVRNSLKNKPPFPSDIEPHKWIDKPNTFLEWDMETLAREVVICCNHQPNPSNSLKKANDMAKAVNKMREIEDYIAENYISQKNILREVTVRLTHRQFKYRTDRPSIESMVRYSKIFGSEDVAPFLKEKVGIDAKKLFTLGIGMWSHYTHTFGMYYPLEHLDITDITEKDYEKFMSYFSKSLSELKKLLTDSSERHFDDKFFYGYHSLYSYPIVFTEIDSRPAHVCPVPTLLYWRISSGLYYDLISEKGFDNAFGKSFENYVGSVLETTFSHTSTVKLFSGEKNTGKNPNTCDWIIDQASSCIFLECKTKRLAIDAKTTLLNDDVLFKQLGVLGDAIAQCYLSLTAYVSKKYKSPKYILTKDKSAYIGVVTLEKWFLMGEQLELLDEIVKEKLENAGLDISLIKMYPYVVMSVDDVEELAFLAKSLDVGEVIRSYIDKSKKQGWEFATHLIENYKKERASYRYVFQDDIQNALTAKITNKSQ
jgi:hypothetical protein